MGDYIKNSAENKAKGKDTESNFERDFAHLTMRKATMWEDMNLHWDYQIQAGKHIRTVDVKSGNKTEDILRFELINRMGDNGWGKGGADYIVYEQEDYWLWVKRSDMIDAYKKHTKAETGHWNNPYKLWFQRGSQAVMTFILLEDVETYHKITKKEIDEINNKESK